MFGNLSHVFSGVKEKKQGQAPTQWDIQSITKCAISCKDLTHFFILMTFALGGTGGYNV